MKFLLLKDVVGLTEDVTITGADQTAAEMGRALDNLGRNISSLTQVGSGRRSSTSDNVSTNPQEIKTTLETKLSNNQYKFLQKGFAYSSDVLEGARKVIGAPTFTDATEIATTCETFGGGLKNTIDKINSEAEIDLNTLLNIVNIRLLHLLAEKKTSFENAKDLVARVVAAKLDDPDLGFTDKSIKDKLIKTLNDIIATARTAASEKSFAPVSLSKILQTSYKQHLSSIRPVGAGLANNFENPALWVECLKQQPTPKPFLFAQLPDAKIFSFGADEQIKHLIRQRSIIRSSGRKLAAEEDDIIFACGIIRNLGVQLATLPYFAGVKNAFLTKMPTEFRKHESRLIVEK